MSTLRKQRDDKVDERLSRSEKLGENALDEASFLKDQLKQLQDERKRDVEETADFIKQIITAGKQDWQKEVQRANIEIERIRRELAEKAMAAELADTQKKIGAVLDQKVELREVQQALHEC